jgi:hypothetical protein
MRDELIGGPALGQELIGLIIHLPWFACSDLAASVLIPFFDALSSRRILRSEITIRQPPGSPTQEANLFADTLPPFYLSDS